MSKVKYVKCINCLNEWVVSSKTEVPNICPFCGSKIDCFSPEEGLRTILNRYGIKILSENRRFSSVIRDVFYQNPSLGKMLIFLQKEKFYESFNNMEFSSIDDRQANMFVRNRILYLTENYGMSEENAQFITSLLRNVFSEPFREYHDDENIYYHLGKENRDIYSLIVSAKCGNEEAVSFFNHFNLFLFYFETPNLPIQDYIYAFALSKEIDIPRGSGLIAFTIAKEYAYNENCFDLEKAYYWFKESYNYIKDNNTISFEVFARSLFNIGCKGIEIGPFQDAAIACFDSLITDYNEDDGYDKREHYYIHELLHVLDPKLSSVESSLYIKICIIVAIIARRYTESFRAYHYAAWAFWIQILEKEGFWIEIVNDIWMYQYFRWNDFDFFSNIIGGLPDNKIDFLNYKEKINIPENGYIFSEILKGYLFQNEYFYDRFGEEYVGPSGFYCVDEVVIILSWLKEYVHLYKNYIDNGVMGLITAFEYYEDPDNDDESLPRFNCIYTFGQEAAEYMLKEYNEIKIDLVDEHTVIANHFLTQLTNEGTDALTYITLAVFSEENSIINEISLDDLIRLITCPQDFNRITDSFLQPDSKRTKKEWTKWVNKVKNEKILIRSKYLTEGMGLNEYLAEIGLDKSDVEYFKSKGYETIGDLLAIEELDSNNWAVPFMRYYKAEELKTCLSVFSLYIDIDEFNKFFHRFYEIISSGIKSNTTFEDRKDSALTIASIDISLYKIFDILASGKKIFNLPSIAPLEERDFLHAKGTFENILKAYQLNDADLMDLLIEVLYYPFSFFENALLSDTYYYILASVTLYEDMKLRNGDKLSRNPYNVVNALDCKLITYGDPNIIFSSQVLSLGKNYYYGERTVNIPEISQEIKLFIGKDIELSLKFFLQAYKMGMYEAAIYLAEIYERGLGDKWDFKNGRGIKPDLFQAIEMYTVAANNGNEHAKVWLKNLPEVIKEGKNKELIREVFKISLKRLFEKGIISHQIYIRLMKILGKYITLGSVYKNKDLLKGQYLSSQEYQELSQALQKYGIVIS